MARWVTGTAIRHVWHRFWQDAHQLPKQTWKRWGSTLALSFGLCAIWTFGVMTYAKSVHDQWLQAWDSQLLPLIVERLPLTFAQGITWESFGNLMVMLPTVTIFIVIMVLRSRPILAASMVAAYGAQFALVWISWGLWDRPRPDLVADGIAAPSLHSFPSGHVVVITVVYGLMVYLWLRASHSWIERIGISAIALLFVALVSSARLALGAHWPSDIIGGWLIGFPWLMGVIAAIVRAESVSHAVNKTKKYRING